MSDLGDLFKNIPEWKPPVEPPPSLADRAHAKTLHAIHHAVLEASDSFMGTSNVPIETFTADDMAREDAAAAAKVAEKAKWDAAIAAEAKLRAEVAELAGQIDAEKAKETERIAMRFRSDGGQASARAIAARILADGKKGKKK